VRSPGSTVVGLLLVTTGAVAWFASDGAAAPTAAPRVPAAASGRELYVTGCSSCHGLSGRGVRGRGPSLEHAGEASAWFYLTTGRMPLDRPGGQARRKEPVYDRPQIDRLTRYVASLGDGPRLPELHLEDARLPAGFELYQANCASCHNSAGSGGALGGDTYAPSLTAATPLQVAAAIRVGPGAMPVFGHRALPPKQLDDIVRYVGKLQAPDDRGGIPLGRVGPVPEGFVAGIVGLGVLLLAARWIGTRT
jgi:ubiquinol-cytochrome c reductase cytochrome c subunit